MAAELLTPTQYANRKGIRPQYVYNWIKKQGAPVHYKNGKPHVKERELDKWQKDKDERKKQRQLNRALKGGGGGTKKSPVPAEYIDKLAKFGGVRVKHLCSNCAKETEFLVDITYTGYVAENHTWAYCLECRQNARSSPSGMTNEYMQDILDGKIVPEVPDPDNHTEQLRIAARIEAGEIDEFGNPKTPDKEKLSNKERCFECDTVMIEDPDSDLGTYCPKCESVLEAERQREDAALASN